MLNVNTFHVTCVSVLIIYATCLQLRYGMRHIRTFILCIVKDLFLKKWTPFSKKDICPKLFYTNRLVFFGILG